MENKKFNDFFLSYRCNCHHDKTPILDDFMVFRLEESSATIISLLATRQRGYYVICLIQSGLNLYYQDNKVKLQGSNLVLFNPHKDGMIEFSEKEVGFGCIFSEAFCTEYLKELLYAMPIVCSGENPFYSLSKSADIKLSWIFKKMLNEVNTDYRFKYNLIGIYVIELVHHLLKFNPRLVTGKATDANSRITLMFSELLEKQFPIRSTMQRVVLRSARDFAQQMFLHVNHLNKAIKQTTGRTTSNVIAQRLMGEAVFLLKNTDWTIAEIAYSLGFEEPAHFNNFFKRHSKLAPSVYRNCRRVCEKISTATSQ